MIRAFLLFGFLFSLPALGQVKDAHLWGSIGLKLDITKKIAVDYETQTRFYKNASALDSYINEAGVKYKLNKKLDVSLDYRYSRKNQESYFEGVHRLALNFSAEHEFENLGLEIKGRVRYQVPFNYLGIINDAIYPDNRNVMRFKVGAKYTPVNLKKIQPYASYEIYKSLNPINAYNAIDSYRFNFGLSFDLPKRHSLDVGYLFEREFRSVPQLNHIYTIGYTYKLTKKPLIKKKKD